MIRFMPDSWRDAVFRPIAMADPNGGIYTEILAPDFRFLIAITLAIVALLGIAVNRKMPVGSRPVFVLLGLTALSFVPWLETTGNGRYFMTYLILIGPLCIGMVNILSFTRSMKASVATLIVGLQAFALYQNNPWNPFDTWESISWHTPPYFNIELDSHKIDQDTTYISIASMSYSLVAPKFPQNSRWINLSTYNGSDVSSNSRFYVPVQKIIESSKNLKLFQRSAPRAMIDGTDQPNQNAIQTINDYLEHHSLALKEPTDCQLLKSKSLLDTTLIAKDDDEKNIERISEKTGFWICSLQRTKTKVKHIELTEKARQAKEVFEKMETICPRNFAPGQTLVGNHPAGYVREYSSSDSSLIVTNNGDLYVQNLRALNPERLGYVDDILNQRTSIDCTKFKGRSGLPWEREI